MSGSELAQLESLLSRALPDPRGFADRVLEQLLERLAATSPVASPVTIVRDVPVRPGGDQEVLLAAALGACDCWGLDDACDLCAGEGGPGWADPDEELYEELVAPAVRRRAGTATSAPTTTPPEAAARQEGARP